MDHSLAARTLGFDIRALKWSDEMLEAADVDEDKLATLAPSGTVVGTLNPKTAGALNLPEGVNICTGGFDQACGAYGIDVQHAGQAYYGIGTTEALAVVLDDSETDLSSLNMAICPHVLPKKFLAMGGSQTGARLLDWYKTQIAHADVEQAKVEGLDPFDHIIKTTSHGPSDLLFMPHFTGSGTYFNDAQSKGRIWGLSFKTNRREIAKAVLEATTFDQALIVDGLAKIGIDIERLHAVGGATRSRPWMQIKANIMGREILPTRIEEAACRGAAKLAHYGTTKILPKSDKTVQTIDMLVYPDGGEHDIYKERLKLYEKLY